MLYFKTEPKKTEKAQEMVLLRVWTLWGENAAVPREMSSGERGVVGTVLFHSNESLKYLILNFCHHQI